jgi:hypothetical protein
VGAFAGQASLVVTEYRNGKGQASVVHFPTVGDGRIGDGGESAWVFITSDRLTNLQGGVACVGKYYLNRSAGQSNGVLYITTPARTAREITWLVRRTPPATPQGSTSGPSASTPGSDS